MNFLRLNARDWRPLSPQTFVLVAAAILFIQALTLMAMGHPLICECGHIDLWHGSASGPQTSQHLTDWYSVTHVAHGLLFYLLIWLVAPGAPFTVVLLTALGLEANWEMIENTPFIMDRYRQTALAAGYFGDSVVNSIGDTLAMAVGFVWARKVPAYGSVLLFLGSECVLAIVIRDNLMLNIIQLIHPVKAIAVWQAGG
ncbi:DUF2585 family protein [Salinisphaera aquimarina]|uniref:DUF2585 family protein n=1 Tax=Salinisphaera aquimarina TaxID=2094031 RepID=A0ABV7EKB4_9GAMM